MPRGVKSLVDCPLKNIFFAASLNTDNFFLSDILPAKFLKLKYAILKNKTSLLKKKKMSVISDLGKPQKKSYFFSGPTTKRGGVRARPLRKKELFF